MRIVMDARMARWTGVGRYITGLCGALGSADPELEVVLLVNPGDDLSWVPREGRFRAAAARRTIRPYSLKEQVFLRGELLRLEPDLIHIPQFNVPWLGFRPLVVTIHDLIYLMFPEDCPSRLAFVGVNRMIRAAVRRADRILAVSENTRADLERLLGVSPARVRVTPLGPPRPRGSPGDAAAVRARYGLPGDFLLYTGNHSPHKNLKTLLEALALLVGEGRDLRLVVTGPRDRHTPAVAERVKSLGLEPRVRFTGTVPDDDLFALYAEARALVFPSLYEGFGIPPLEGFACGVPVVASNAASIPEVVGDAALLADPRDAGAFRAAIARVLDEPALRADLVARGRRRLEAFSWERTARATVEAYREAAAAAHR
ncbi:MAG: glycosyltransferase family 4 protein [Planctomycetes bacterium]|jgi:alpha-1,3-rhamnosyl/mannosyltransferase|nr:glycosyltransferase family 4 protein [Planctomycetota bacterium]